MATIIKRYKATVGYGVLGIIISISLVESFLHITWQLHGVFLPWPALWHTPPLLQSDGYMALVVLISLLGLVILVYGLWIGQPWRKVSLLLLILLGSYAISLSLIVTVWFAIIGEQQVPWPWLIWPLYILAQQDSVLYERWWWLFGILHGTLAIISLIGWQRLRLVKQGALGNAAFANPLDISRAGLWQSQGLVLGRAYGQVIRRGGFEPALICAPTGSGKTAAIAVPNLIEWRGSLVINDLKGELYRLTAHYRKKLGQSVLLWDPAQRTGHTQSYNPLACVSDCHKERYRDIWLIAECLIGESATNDTFWIDASRDLFTAFAFYLFETQAQTPTIAQIHDLAKHENLIEWIEQHIAPNTFSAPCISQTLLPLIEMDHRTYSNLMSDFRRRLSLWGDPLIRHSTSAHEIDVRRLRQAPISLYVHITENDMGRLSKLLTLFWSQFINAMCDKEPNLSQEPYPVLALLDEFGNLGKIDKLAKGVSFLRSYRLLCVFIIQYHKQLIHTYGPHHGFLNCKTKLIGNLGELEDAKYYADLLGQKTIHVKQTSRSSSGLSSQTSLNEQVQSTPLLRPERLMRLPRNLWLLFSEGYPPARIKKRWWQKSYNLSHQLNQRDK
jgi:type IV secretion system protein VirD4